MNQLLDVYVDKFDGCDNCGEATESPMMVKEVSLFGLVGGRFCPKCVLWYYHTLEVSMNDYFRRSEFQKGRLEEDLLKEQSVLHNLIIAYEFQEGQIKSLKSRNKELEEVQTPGDKAKDILKNDSEGLSETSKEFLQELAN